MKFNFLRLVLPVLIIILIDIYVFQAVKTLCETLTNNQRRAVYVGFWSITVFSICFLLIAFSTDFFAWPKALRNYGIAIIFIVYICKLIILPFLLVDDIIRGIKWLSF